MPGDPGFDTAERHELVIDRAHDEILMALQMAAWDAVINPFSLALFNESQTENDRRDGKNHRSIYREIRVPFGVNVLWDPVFVFDLQYDGDRRKIYSRNFHRRLRQRFWYVWDTNVGETIRHQHRDGRPREKRC